MTPIALEINMRVCFRQMAGTGSFTKAGHNIGLTQAGVGLSILPMGALKAGMRKAPSRMGLPELPMFSVVLLTDEKKKNRARDVFVSYLKAEINKRAM